MYYVSYFVFNFCTQSLLHDEVQSTVLGIIVFKTESIFNKLFLGSSFLSKNLIFHPFCICRQDFVQNHLTSSQFAILYKISAHAYGKKCFIYLHKAVLQNRDLATKILIISFCDND